MQTIGCAARVAFTHFAPMHGMIHGDPDSSDGRARKPQVPGLAIAHLVASGMIVAPEGFDGGAASDSGALPQLDRDCDGAPGGSEPHEPAALTGKNKAALLEIAEAEGAAIPEGATNREIIAAIEAAREGDADTEESPPA